MEDVTVEQRERLGVTATEGDTIRSFCKHAGFKIYMEAVRKELDKRQNLWLKGTDEQARIARLQAQGIEIALAELKKFMLSGDNARRLLTEIVEENTDFVAPQTAVLELGQGKQEK